jgi:hypothetical protein
MHPPKFTYIVRIAPTEGIGGNILEIDCHTPGIAAATVEAALKGEIYEGQRPDFLNITVKVVQV